MTAVRDPAASDRATSRGSLLLPFLAATSLLAWAAPAASQEGGVVALGVEADSDATIPIALEIVRRPGELRLDPVTGMVSGPGVVAGSIALLAHDPATGALFAADFLPTRIPGRVRLDPRTGVPTPEGVPAPTPGTPRPVLVGLDPTTGALAAVDFSLVRVPGTFVLETRSGIVSPAPDNSAILGFDATARALVPIRISTIRGRGLALDPGTGRLSTTAEAGSGAGHLLGIRPDGTVVPVDVDLVHRFGTLAIDPDTGSLVARGEAPEAERGGLSMVGIHAATGALSRMDVGIAPRPGPYAVNIATGRAEPVGAPVPEVGTARSGFVFGGGVDVLQMIEFESVLEQVSVGPPNASEFVPGFHVFAEYVWRLISIGAEAGYTVLESEVLFPQGVQRGDLSYLEAGGSLKVRFPIDANIKPYLGASLLGAWFDGDFDLEGLTEARTHETVRTGLGGGFDYWVSSKWGFRLEAVYNTTFEEDDAADHIRYGFHVVFSPDEVSVPRIPRIPRGRPRGL